MERCLFCEIVEGRQAAEVVEDTDHVLAFRDINPVAPTHVLLIPKEHVASAAELQPRHDGLLGELFRTAAAIAEREGLEGWRLVTNVGRPAGQSVLHLHFHLLGGRQLGWPPG